MRAYFFKGSFILLIMLLCCFPAGCGKKNTTSETTDIYQVYYLDSEGYKLVTEDYYPTDNTEDAEDMYEELLAAMAAPKDVLKHKSVTGNAVLILNHIIDKETLNVYFSESYNNLTPDSEIMFRAAFVKTMTQIEGIKYVCFYVNDQPQKDSLGNTTGIMLASNFVEDLGSGNYSSWVDLSIYYGVSGSDKLAEEKITIGYGKNVSIEQVIIEQLIKGPSEDGHVRTVSPELTLLSVTTKDGVCYVNFDSHLSDSVGVVPSVTIYSIVNTLCGLSNVNRVQISINSENKLMFREKIDLSQPFERNLDIVLK